MPCRHLRPSSGREHTVVYLFSPVIIMRYSVNETRRKPTTGTLCPTSDVGLETRSRSRDRLETCFCRSRSRSRASKSRSRSRSRTSRSRVSAVNLPETSRDHG